MNCNKHTLPFHLLNQVNSIIVDILKVQFPFDDTMCKDKYNEERELVREDSKRMFRVAQIENEGNDPAKSGTTYGTPHDLASMYGRRSTSTPKGDTPLPKGAGPKEVPMGYSEQPSYSANDPKIGRPKEKASVYGTNADPIGGRDRLGIDGMHGGFPSDNETVMENLTTQSVYYKNKDMLKSIVFEKPNADTTDLLNEENIKDLGN